MSYETRRILDVVEAGQPTEDEWARRPHERTRDEIESWVVEAVHDSLGKDEVEPGKIISIYGMGGEGKTHLLERLRYRLTKEEDSRFIVVFHSFDEYWAAPTDQILKDLAMLFVYKGIPCPSFLMTYYSYRALKSNAQIAAREFAEDYSELSQSSPIERLLQLADFSAPFIDAVFGIGGIPLPVGGVLDAVVGLVDRTLLERRRRAAEKSWKQIEHFQTSAELYAQLAPMLVQDLENWGFDKRNRGKRIVVLLDTFERVGGEMSRGFRRYEWARLLTNVPGTIWIIAGRIKVAWDNTVPVPAHLVDMSSAEADELLIGAGVEDTDARKVIKRLTKCLPVYLNLCARQYKQYPAKALSDLDLATTREELLERFLRNTRDNNRRLVYAAAFLEHWDVSLVSNVADAMGLEADIEFLNSLSFVTCRDENAYEMHEVVADVLRRSSDIRQLKRSLYAIIAKMLDGLRAAEEIPECDRLERELQLLRVKCRLLDAGVARVSAQDSFRTYMDYAEGIWRYGNIDRALDLYRAIANGYGTDDKPTPEFLRAKLKVGAMYTQLYLANRECEHHAHAIVLAEEVLEQARDHFSDDGLLVQSALNDLGVSWARFKEFRKALRYQEDLYRQISAKGVEGMTADEARFVNNYGSTCQQYGDSLEDSAEKRAMYKKACEAYELSFRARCNLAGENSAAALISQTNLGVIQARLGDYVEARSIVSEARTRYEQAGFDSSTPGFQRCGYQLAMFDETEARQLMGIDDDRARSLLHSALKKHQLVYDLRAKSLSPLSVDMQKSNEQVKVCKQLLKSLGEDAA